MPDNVIGGLQAASVPRTRALVLAPAQVIAYPHPFARTPVIAQAPAGRLVDMFPGLEGRVSLSLDGRIINAADWHRIEARPGALVELVGRPGNNDILRSIAMIAVTVAAAWVAGPAVLGLDGWMYGATVAGITLAGSLAVNALIPPMAITPPDLTGTTRGSLTGIKNQVNPYGLIPDMMGKNKVYPTIVGRPVIEASGNDQYLRVLFAVGLGDYELADLRIGDTSVGNYADIEIAVGGVTVDSDYGGVVKDDDPLSLYKRDVSEAILADTLTATSGPTTVTRTTAANTTEIGIDFVMPAGLRILSKKNEDRPTGVVLAIEYSPTGQNNWTSFAEAPTPPWSSQNVREILCGDGVTRHMIFGWTNDTLRASLSLPVNAGQYDVRITPYTAVTAAPAPISFYDGASIVNDSWASFEVQPWANDHGDFLHNIEVHWVALRSWQDGAPVSQELQDNATLIGMRIRESNQLSGIVDQFSLWATRKLRQWDGSQWLAASVTRSPAWAYVQALTGPASPRPFADAKLNLAELKDWADWCATNGFYYDSRADQDMTLADRLAEICAAGRASWAKYDGLFTVVRDSAPTVPVQMLTPRNSWGYTGQGAFPDLPHALKITFVNEDTGADDIQYVYDDGYSVDGAGGTTVATKFETLSLPGVTNPTQVYKLGRYHLAQLRLRPETHALNVDIESLRCRRGSLVRCAHDVPEWAAGFGRIIGVTTDVNGDVTAFTSDEELTMDGVSTYAAHIRVPSESDTIITQQVQTVAGATRELTFTAPVSGVEVGQLFALGDVVDMLVTRIEAGPDRSAKLTLVDAAPAIQNADSGPIPAWNSNITVPLGLDQIRPPKPTVTAIRTDESVLLRDSDGSTRIRAVAWFRASVQVGLPHLQVEMLYRSSTGANPWSVVGPISAAAGVIDTTNVVQGDPYDFQLRLRNGSQVSDWSDVQTETIVGKSTPPADVTGFMAAQNGAAAVMRLTPNTEPDLGGYEFRYGPRVNNFGSVEDAWTNARLLTLGDPGNSITTADIPPGDWRVYVKAFDTSTPKNYSANAAYDDLNFVNGNEVIAESAQAPMWGGTLTNFARHWTGVLVPESTKAASDHTVPELFEQFVPYPQASCIYETPEIDIGFDDAVRIWSDLHAYLGRGIATGTPTPAVEMDYRAEAGSYSGYRPWSIGNRTGRYFKFRITLDTSVGVSVVDKFTPTIDGAHHSEVIENIDVASAGTAVVFGDKYHTVPRVDLTYEGSQPYSAVADNVTDTGFTAYIYDITTGNKVASTLRRAVVTGV